MKIGIVGLGLMGGSLALSLKKLPFVREIVGYDHNAEHQKIALERQLIHNIVDFQSIKACDVIFLAIPVNAITALFKDLTDLPKETTLIDLGGTKERILKAVPLSIRRNFVAAHPMAGTEYYGPSAAIENLFKDKIVVLCDLEESGEHQQEVAVRLFSGIHMQLHYMRSHDHDRHAAYISHMPHIISFSLANTVLSQEEKENILLLAAGGFRSMSRLAKSSPQMWEDIFRQNKNNVLHAIEHFEKELTVLKRSLKDDDWDTLHQRMKAANKLQDIFS